MDTQRRPAILGGTPVFSVKMPLARPTVPDVGGLTGDLERIFSSGVLTNGPYVRRLEQRTAEYLQVKHCVAVSSCTSGLMLTLQALGLSGSVVVPSFTFAATVHAVAWNGLRPLFADIDAESLTLSPEAVVAVIAKDASAVMATHLYGTPCDEEGLEDVAQRNGLGLVFDAAHAFGSRRRGDPVGARGDAQVFSLTPTKPLVGSEGGLVATNNESIADHCRIGRDYGNPGDYDCRFVGLNARMSEVHAAMALISFDSLEERISSRNHLAARYRAELEGVHGISFPVVHERDRSTYKDLTVLVDADSFGMTAQVLAAALARENIETRRYYHPPVHRMTAYAPIVDGELFLPVTDHAADGVVTLPLWEGMASDDVEKVATAIGRIKEFSSKLSELLIP